MLPESIEKERNLGRHQRENFRHAFQSGAKIAYGTDSGVYPHGDNAKQFATMVEWGMKPIDAIQAATINAADLIGWKDRVGVRHHRDQRRPALRRQAPPVSHLRNERRPNRPQRKRKMTLQP
jgi:hypothetical protein